MPKMTKKELAEARERLFNPRPRHRAQDLDDEVLEEAARRLFSHDLTKGSTASGSEPEPLTESEVQDRLEEFYRRLFG